MSESKLNNKNLLPKFKAVFLYLYFGHLGAFESAINHSITVERFTHPVYTEQH